MELELCVVVRITPACAGKSGMEFDARRGHGITPACAGKSDGLLPVGLPYRNHSRMRGEEPLKGEPW